MNAVLVRPISFYEFYFSQFLGYKLVTVVFSFVFPLAISLILKVPLHVERLPLMLALLTYYLAFAYTISFCVACLAFFMNRAQSLTVVKNMTIWALTGELIPLDLFPEPLRTWMMHSPFAAGAYIPTAYITGRIETPLIVQSFASVSAGIVVLRASVICFGGAVCALIRERGPDALSQAVACVLEDELDGGYGVSPQHHHPDLRRNQLVSGAAQFVRSALHSHQDHLGGGMCTACGCLWALCF